MKFLCVTCDEPMKLETVEPSGGGSLSVVYACPTCDHKIAMLTNSLETEMVQSLGVKIGPAEARAEGAAPPAGGCPFPGIVQEMEAEATRAADASGGPVWTPDALARLENIPGFVRPMAKQGIEHYARTHGHATIDEEVLEAARGKFGM
jgi:DNA-directed RNA polymerase subunit RPC12/RpoP